MNSLKLSEIEIEQCFSKNVEIGLLYFQSLEIQMLYNQEIPKNSFNPTKYYLLPKKWIDEYKSKFNYNFIKKNYNIDDCSNYDDFKSKIIQSNSFLSKNSESSQNLQMSPIEGNFIQIPRKKIQYPVDFFPVKEEILRKYLVGKNDYLYELIIGGNNIFIIDNKSKKNIFVCSLNYDNDEVEEIDDFVINVNYILMYNKDNTFKNEIKKYSSKNKGFNNYCKERNINLNLNNEQDLLTKEGEKIGNFLQINNIGDNTPDGFLDEYINYHLQNQNNNIQNQNNIIQYQNNNIQYLNNNIQYNNNNIKYNNIQYQNNNIQNQNNNIQNQNNNIQYQNNNNIENPPTLNTKINFVGMSLSVHHQNKINNNNNSINSNNNENNLNQGEMSYFNQNDDMNMNNNINNPIFQIMKNRRQSSDNIPNIIHNNFPNNPQVNQNYIQNNFNSNLKMNKSKNIIICFDGEIWSQIQKPHITVSVMNLENQNMRFKPKNININGPNNNYNNYGNNNFNNNISIENANNFNNNYNMMMGQNPNNNGFFNN